MGKMEKKRREKRRNHPKRRRRKKFKHPAAPKHVPRTRTKPHPQGGSRHSWGIVKTFLCADEYRSSETQNCATHLRRTTNRLAWQLASLVALSSLSPWDLGPTVPGSQEPKDPGSWKLREGEGTEGQGKKTHKNSKKETREVSIKKEKFGRISWVVCPSFKDWALQDRQHVSCGNLQDFFSENDVPSGNLHDVSDRPKNQKKIFEQFHVENLHKQTSGDIFWRLVGEGGVMLALPWPWVPSVLRTWGPSVRRSKVQFGFQVVWIQTKSWPKKKGRNKCKNPQTVGRKFLLTFQSKKKNDYWGFWCSVGHLLEKFFFFFDDTLFHQFVQIFHSSEVKPLRLKIHKVLLTS